MSELRRVVALGVFGVGALLVLGSPTGTGQPNRIDCRPAVLVDGVLACGAESPDTWAVPCDGAATPTRSGDVLRSDGACSRGRMPARDLAALGVPINVNADTAEDLTSLPGVGPILAGRIVEGRPYTTADDLQSVKGIGPIRLARMRHRVLVN